MSRNSDDGSLLLKDKSFIRFDRLLHRAEGEGRIGGPFSCSICGMHYMTKGESVDCCNLAGRLSSPAVSGPIISGVSKTRLPAKKPVILLRLKVADGAPDTAFTLDGAMLDVLNTINLNNLLPDEAIIRNTENDRMLLVCLFSLLLEEAGGDRKCAFRIAVQNGMTMHPIKWGMLVARLVRLGVLIPVTTQNNHPVSEAGDNSPLGDAVENEKASEE